MSSEESILANERKRVRNLLRWEKVLWEVGLQFIAGVDEAGRGPLAGPVVAAAVVFARDPFIPGIDDSKKLRPSRREQLAAIIYKQAIAVGISVVYQDEIDRINIRQASLLAMSLAIENLSVIPEMVLVDGRDVPPVPVPGLALIKGDSISFSIAAASVIAKVKRDRMMQAYHQLYPNYGFIRNKGYATREHLLAIERYGPCPIHRFTYHPVCKVKKNDGKL